MPLGKSLPLWFGENLNPASGQGLSCTTNRLCTVWTRLWWVTALWEAVHAVWCSCYQVELRCRASLGAFSGVICVWNGLHLPVPVACSETHSYIYLAEMRTTTEIQLKSITESDMDGILSSCLLDLRKTGKWKLVNEDHELQGPGDLIISYDSHVFFLLLSLLQPLQNYFNSSNNHAIISSFRAFAHAASLPEI